jgi:hypothetical protein
MMPPVSSRSARDDAQYLNDEAGTPADSTGAARCRDRDFGTSRWQLSINATRNCCGAGGGSWPEKVAPIDRLRVRYQGHSRHDCHEAARKKMTQLGSKECVAATNSFEIITHGAGSRPPRRSSGAAGGTPCIRLMRRHGLARVPHPEQWRARQDILAATPRNIGAPERAARQCMPRDLYE